MFILPFTVSILRMAKQILRNHHVCTIFGYKIYMMKTLCTTICWLLAFTLNAQVSINTNGAAPAANTMLDIKSNNKGVQFPHMNAAERKAIPVTPADAGLMVYDITQQALYMFDGMEWFPFAFGGKSNQPRSYPVSNASQSAALGSSCAIDGDYAVIGAQGDSVNGIPAGSAFVFQRVNGFWIQKAKLVAPDAGSYELFGSSVVIEGTNIIVGATAARVGNVQQGAAYYFTRSGDTWTFQQKIFANDGNSLADFSNAMFLQGNMLFVASKRKKVGNNNLQGSVYVLTRLGNSWSHLTQLTANDGGNGDLFGSSIDVSGNTIVIGAPSDDNSLSDQGSAYVFTRNNTVFSFQQKLTLDALGAYDKFGTAVTIDGDNIAVGSPGSDILSTMNRGMVFFFKRNGNTWSQASTLDSEIDATQVEFGGTLLLRNGLVIVGAPYQSLDGLVYRGAVYVYRYPFINNSYVLKRYTDPEGLEFDFFGGCIAVQGNTILIGARGARNEMSDADNGRIFFGKIE